MAEIITIECPFCKQTTIKISHRPESYTIQTIRVGSNVKRIPKVTPGNDEVLSESCSNCGKTKKEIQKALKEGVKLSHEQVLERARKAGLPLRF